MKGRRILVGVVGIAQSIIGAFALIFAFILYFKFFDVQNTLGIPSIDVPLYTLFVLMLGFLFIITGRCLIQEWRDLKE